MKVKTLNNNLWMVDKNYGTCRGTSRSKVELDLEVGSLVVKTKKLNKGSVFDKIPVVAGIRGTEFQMASMPGKGYSWMLPNQQWHLLRQEEECLSQ